MNEYRRTINRRTFVKTVGGLIISLPFTAALSKSHAAELPDSLTFRLTVAVRDVVNGQTCLDTSTSGYMTVLGPDQTRNDYRIITGGQLEFLLPTRGTSMLVLNVYGLTSRYWLATFENGLLYLRNSDRADRAVIYNWNPIEGCYTIEYYQDNIYICGPADPDGYFLSMPYQSLNPQLAALAGRRMVSRRNIKVSPVPMASCVAGCNPSRCATWVPSCSGCSYCQSGDTEDNFGVPDNSTVSHGSSSELPVGHYDLIGVKDPCRTAEEKCAGEDNSPATFADSEIDYVSGIPLRLTVTPSKTAWQNIRQQADPRAFPIVDFGLKAGLWTPSMDPVAEGYVALGGTTSFAQGVNINIQWTDDPTRPQMYIRSRWPRDLFQGAKGPYLFSGRVVTADGQSSNCRNEFFQVIA